MKPTQEEFKQWRAEKLSCTREQMETKIGGPCLDFSGNTVGTVVSVDDVNWYWKPNHGLNAYLIYGTNEPGEDGYEATLVYAESEEKAKESFNQTWPTRKHVFEKDLLSILQVDFTKTEPEVIDLGGYYE